MKYLVILPIIFLINLKSNCQELERIVIDPSNATESINFTDVFDDFQIVPLETSNKGFIGEVRKIGVWKEKIYLMDPFKARSVVVFDKKGNFKYRLGKEGKGPGEYIMPRDICGASESVILINSAKGIIHYDYEGKFLKEERFEDLTASSIIELNGQNYALITGNWFDHLYIVNNKLRKKRSFFPYNQRVYRASIYDPLQNDGNGNVIYRCNLNDTIYRIKESRPTPHYLVDFKKLSIPQRMINMYSNSMATLSEKCSQYCQLSRYYEVSDQIVLTFRYKEQSYFALYDKKAKQTSIVKKEDFQNDITFCSYRLIGKDLESDMFIFLVEPFNLLEDLQKKLSEVNNPKVRQDLEKLSKNLTDTSNPILLFAKLKTF